MLPFVLSLLAGPASALTPPIGWTADGANRALLDPSDPGKGELREFAVVGGVGEPDELTLMLRAAGLTPDGFNPLPDGAVDLVVGTKVGRARAKVQIDGAKWVVVLADQATAYQLDPDALLTAALPADTVAWGQVDVPAAGGDGAPWGAVGGGAQGGWIDAVAVEPWVQDPELVGLWTGSAMLSGQPTTLNVRFESTGLVRIERKTKADVQVEDGAWATRKGRIRMEIPGGGDDLDYQIRGSTLTIEYFEARVTLYKR